jgi:hypothetical protein
VGHWAKVDALTELALLGEVAEVTVVGEVVGEEAVE